MTDDRSDRPPAAGLLDALRVRRNATVGIAVGLTVAALGYLVRVFELVGPVAGGRSYPVVGPGGWFLLLGFVLASATALLVTAALTAATAYRRVRRL